MAVPIISSIVASSGPSAGGHVITITGTGFAVPVIAYTVPMVALTPTVSVTVGGRSARAVRVISATEIKVLTPRYRGVWRDAATGALLDVFPAQDVVVKNLDSVGIPVPGEVVTKAGGYIYQRWSIGETSDTTKPITISPIQKVLEVLIGDMIRDICRDVVMSTHVDYGEEGSAEVVDLASLPYIGLRLSIPRDVEYSEEDRGWVYVPTGSGTWDEYAGAYTRMLVLDLTICGETTSEVMYLCQAVEEFVQVNPELAVSADENLFPGLTDMYPVEISGWPVQASRPGNSPVVASVMQMRVRGIQVLPDVPVQNINQIASFVLGETDMTGKNVTEVTL